MFDTNDGDKKQVHSVLVADEVHLLLQFIPPEWLLFWSD
jgi:hypothetical protein